MFSLKRRYKCILCNKYHDEVHILYKYKGIGVCRTCMDEIRTGGDKTFFAKEPVAYVLAPFLYEGKIKAAVKRYKFSGQKAYGVLFGEMIYDEISRHKPIYDFECVVPIPLHSNRLLEREYNQAEIIAEVIAEKLNIPCITDALFRVRETKKQSNLTSRDRMDNVKSAFYAVERPILGKSILLVDDIFTMGETMSAAANALMDAGSLDIIGICLCKPLLKERPLYKI